MYNNPTLYDDMMWWKKDDIDFWLSRIKENKSKKILELCCWTGRIGLPLIAQGLDYYGIDSSQNFITHFKSQITDSNYNLNHIKTEDIRKFNINETFDFIFIGFNSLAHLLTDKDLSDCFNSLKKHMHKNTLFAIDIFVPSPSFLYRDDKDKFDMMDFLYSTTNEKINIIESIDYNPLTEINHIHWEFVDKNKICKFQFQFDMRMYYPDTLNRVLTDCGYHIQNLYGDYHTNKFDENSEKQIYFCKLAG